MKSTKHSKAKAFTLIELSIIILIIGIMLAGTFIGTRLVAKSRLAAAESLARSSPIPGIKDNMLWLETSLSGSIDTAQANDGNAVTSWYDQSSNSAKPLVVAVGSGPTYANTINYVHAIKFIGSTANYLQISDASFLNNTDYTIMVLEKRQSSGSNNYFLGEASANPNDSLALGYSSDSTVIHAQGNQSYTTSATVSSYASSTDKPRQFTFVHSSTAGNSTYINGILAAADATKTAHLSGISSLAIGKGYTGEIGEIAIYARALKPEERQPIEDYAGKKWTRSINRIAVPNGSCLGYTITESGCDLSASPCSINVTGLVASVSPTSSSTSINCNQTNYSGSVNYTCVSGAASVSGSCTSAIPCTLSLTGSSNTSSVASGASGSMTCNSTGYSGTVSYSCSNGTASYGGSCSCNTGGGYVASGGSCVLGASCSTTSVTGVSTPASVAHMATGSLTCDSANHFTGSVTYNCNNGSLNPSGSCTCASGYAMTGGSCVAVAATCTATNPSGTTITPIVSGSEKYFLFTVVGNSTLNCAATITAKVLVVGGGGGAGSGGGGGGGVQYNASYSLSSGNTTVTVGGGGAGGSGTNGSGTNGTYSQLGSITANGGGGGGSLNANKPGLSGASSGGAGCDWTAGVSSATQGNIGGASFRAGYGSGGGGGGSGSAGTIGTSISGDVGAGGNGGNGTANSITDSSVSYGGGGGGGINSNSVNTTSGGLATGGGGAGARSPNGVGTAGTANTGGGGGGGDCEGAGGSGGSGIVIVRIPN